MRYRSFLLSVLIIIGSTCSGATAFAAASSSTQVILRMGDGRFYDPASGRSAATEAELRAPEVPLSPPPALISGFVDGSATSSVPIDPLTTTSTYATTTAPLLDSPLSRAVQRGKILLLDRRLSSSTKATTQDDWRPVDLAIWTPETDVLVPVRIQKKGAGVRLAKDVLFKIEVRTASSLNSTYTVTSLTDPATTPRVVAVRYPLYHPVTTGKKTTYQIEEVIYTPYARSLHTPEMIARGKAYLDQQINEVYQGLEQKKIASATSPDKLVTEVIRPEVAKAILLIEHAGQEEMKRDPQDTLEMFYTELGLNERLTYAYEESPVGASGAPQFMPATYKLLTRQTELQLNPDFKSGMRDLGNGMTAQVVYLDRLLSVMPDTVRTSHANEPYEAGAYVVAAYNTGEGRVKRAVKAWGEDWDESHATKLASLQSQKTKLANEVAALKKKLKTKAVTASATQTKTVKKQLATAQSQQSVVNSQIDALQNSTLRKETVGYLQKYRLVLPYLVPESELAKVQETVKTASL